MAKRASGILFHISSLPSAYGIGDLGPSAFSFVDFLAAAGQSFWQILPLNPIDPVYGSSPYHSISAFAGNPLFVSPELLVNDDLLNKKELNALSSYPKDRVDYQAVATDKRNLLNLAYIRFKENKDKRDFERKTE